SRSLPQAKANSGKHLQPNQHHKCKGETTPTPIKNHSIEDIESNQKASKNSIQFKAHSRDVSLFIQI
ncbi:MAG: hypothetical protein O7C60_01175, partial [Rickettsia endosymbiont of Ixodes persulcatus]|nr:hypothetical protein [Rickettsia endosymbiont of Ixodes persulcatus]